MKKLVFLLAGAANRCKLAALIILTAIIAFEVDATFRAFSISECIEKRHKIDAEFEREFGFTKIEPRVLEYDDGCKWFLMKKELEREFHHGSIPMLSVVDAERLIKKAEHIEWYDRNPLFGRSRLKLTPEEKARLLVVRKVIRNAEIMRRSSFVFIR